jgi:hypothetical protein
MRKLRPHVHAALAAGGADEVWFGQPDIIGSAIGVIAT